MDYTILLYIMQIHPFGPLTRTTLLLVPRSASSVDLSRLNRVFSRMKDTVSAWVFSIVGVLYFSGCSLLSVTLFVFLTNICGRFVQDLPNLCSKTSRRGEYKRGALRSCTCKNRVAPEI
eukprot:sb/3476263/